MSADDVSKLPASYHSHPDIFQDVLAEQPAIMKFLSNPLIGAALGAVAAKWFGGHRSKRASACLDAQNSKAILLRIAEDIFIFCL